MNDFRFAFRQLLKNPGFTAVAVLTLALSIGANTTVFSVMNGILLRSLPVPNPQELRVIEWSGANVHNTRNSGNRSDDGTGRVRQDAFSYPLFVALREQCSAQADVFGYALLHGTTVRAGKETVAAEGLMVSDNFFSGLGVRPLMGQLVVEDQKGGAGPGLVISYRWWDQLFNRDQMIVGKSVALNGFNFSIVGVLPPEFNGVQSGAPVQFYVPFSAQPQLLPPDVRTAPDRWWVPLLARLKPGISDAQLQATLEVGFARGAASFMEKPRILLTEGRAGPDWGRRSYRGLMYLLLGVGCLVMLVASANVTGLLLARGAARQQEFAIRAALGAVCWRLIRLSVLESALLAGAGGGLGTLLALWGKAGMCRLLTGSAEGLQYNTSLNLTVLAFTLAVSVAAALLSGLLPALRAAAVDPRVGIVDRALVGAARFQTGRVLVVSQIALSMLLIVGAGLAIRTVVNLKDIYAGFPTERLMLFQVNPGNAGYQEPRIASFYDRVQQALSEIPGVNSTALIRFPLLNKSGASTSVVLRGQDSDPSHELGAQTLIVSESFFKTMGIGIQLGRELRSSDSLGAPALAIVNETFVRKYLGDRDPIGLTLHAEGADWQIAGVCRDTKFADIKEEAPPTVYWSFRQKSTGSAWFALRTALPRVALAAAARKVISTIDPSIPLTDLTTQEAIRDKAMSQERTFATLCGALAGLSILLSCNGLYGLLAYRVSRRTAEIGLRMALGATRWQIATAILKDAVVLGVAGIAVGLPLTLALTRVIRARLYGVGPSDPITLFLAAALLLAIGFLATWIPARRAMRVDPLSALRCE